MSHIDSLCWGCVRGLHPRLQHCIEKAQDLPGSLWANNRLSCTSPPCPGSNTVTSSQSHNKHTGFSSRGWVVFAPHLWCAVIEAHLVANLSTQSALHLLGYPLGHCDGSHSAGLGDADFAIFTNTYTKREGSGCHTFILTWQNSHCQGQDSKTTAYLLDADTVEVVWFSRCRSHRWPPEKCCL